MNTNGSKKSENYSFEGAMIVNHRKKSTGKRVIMEANLK
jgi:hypothetical protein